MTKIAVTIFSVLAIAVVCANATCTWTAVNNQFATIAACVACAEPDVCIAPVADNGQGSLVLETKDGGKTWSQVAARQELAYLGCAAQSNSAVATSMLDAQYSVQPSTGQYNFTTAAGTSGLTSQNAETIDGLVTGYGVTGQNIFGGNGVAISTNSGASFTFYNVSIFKTFARYGSFPSATTWFLSAGEWPNNQNDIDSVEPGYMMSRRIRVAIDKEGRSSYKYYAAGKRDARYVGDDADWKAQIVKTTDGGKSWTSVFYQHGTFYFNQIDCFTTTHCVAVGEADTSSAPGIRIFTTTDGGKNWAQTLYNSDPDLSIFAVNMISDTEVWASGGNLSELGITGYFWHSVDGGNTWTNTTVAGVYTNDMDFVSENQGYATAFNQYDLSSFLVCQ